MADFAFNPSAAHRSSERYDGRDYEVELSEVPRSRAPSYASKNWQGNDNDDESLLHRDRAHSFYDDPKVAHAGVQRVVSQTPTAKSNRERRKKLNGWRFGVAVSAGTAFTVLLLNLILTITGAVKFGTIDGVGTAIKGDCSTVNTWTTWTHILINALSSILLSASNYTMQCLCSPTRKEIDKAHARGDWMDIGVASVRNIFKIDWRRSLIWWLLALSSVPIHLLYNSAIFKTLDANEYYMAVVNPDFLAGNPFASSTYGDSSVGYVNGVGYTDLRSVQKSFSNTSAYQNLSNSDCIAAYGTSFVSGRTHVLAMTEAKGNQTNNTMFYASETQYELEDSSGGPPPWSWICEDLSMAYDSCDVNAARRNATNWTIDGKKIEYCLSLVKPSYCKLQFSIHILLAVIIMNACKAACMFLTLHREKDATLVTMGDALSSFLESPDELTKGRCLMAKVDVNKGPLRWRVKGVKGTPNTQPLPLTYYAPLRRRWFAAASIKRWCVTMGLCVAALITAASLLGAGVTEISTYLSGQSVFSLGWGAVDSRALINAGLPQGGSSGLVAAVLLANLPQAIVSFLYLTYNGLFTCMLLCHEWSKFAMEGRRKALRVTTARGSQRSTYYLQLPYTYSIPLIIASGTLHWLISQSIFLARVSVYELDGTNSEADDVSEVGYSPSPILSVIMLGIFMLIAALGFGFRRFASHIPVAGSCSVAIAAAAHRPKDDVDAAFLPVRWGDVHREGSDEIGHCCFTSEEVQDLIPGRMYAGSNQSLSTADEVGWHPRLRKPLVQS